MRTIEDVRAAANARPHRCHAYMCIAQVPGDRPVCEPHMAMLPPWLCIKLEKAYDPRAATAWPVDLIAEAIRFTMSGSQMAALTDVVNQNEMFATTSMKPRAAGGAR